jgi:hypothetical protein
MCTWHITGDVGWTLQHDEVFSGYFIQLDDYTESGAIAKSTATGRLWSGPLTSAVGEVCITFWYRLSQNGKGDLYCLLYLLPTVVVKVSISR